MDTIQNRNDADDETGRTSTDVAPEEERQDLEEACAAIAESLADESGDMLLEDYVARHKAKFGG